MANTMRHACTPIITGILYSTLQLSTDHCDGCTQAPAQLSSLDLLPNLNHPLIAELVTESEQRVHEGHVEAPLWPVLELGISALSPPQCFVHEDRPSHSCSAKDAIVETEIGDEDGVEVSRGLRRS